MTLLWDKAREACYLLLYHSFFAILTDEFPRGNLWKSVQDHR